MDSFFPLGLPSPTIWYVVLYIVTLLLHVVFMSYVLAGSIMLGVAGLRGMLGRGARASAWAPVTAVLKDWMPFALSAAITAGIAPLLFVQILYQQEFYTANLLSFHRWMAILPVLIVAFYLLYLLKAHRIEGRTALQGVVAVLVMGAVLFVAWSWIENHLLSLDRSVWPRRYESGAMLYLPFATVPRLAFWVTSAFATAAVLLGWQLRVRASGIEADSAAPALRVLMRVGSVFSVLSLAFVGPGLGVLRFGPEAGLAQGAFHLAAATLAGGLLLALGLLSAAARPGAAGGGLTAASFGVGLFWIGALSARELVRVNTVTVDAVRARHESVGTLAGFVVFLAFAVIGIGTIAWIVRAVRRAQ